MLAKSTSLRWGLALMLVFFSLISFAQRVVTGRVTGADNQPASGATVTVSGTSTATQTDASGNFSLSVPQGRNSLTISYVGFENQTVAISGSSVSVALRAATSSLSEVVVTGYGTQRKKDITGSVAVVNVGALKQQPVGTGAEALQGQASGVTIITSGQPGAASDIRIRGITAFGNNSPLVIVDGVRGDLQNININDVESMQVLKDASAAIYGIAGSNGVIIITTKRGRSGKARLSYDSYYGVTTQGKGYQMASTQEEANAIWLQQKNSGIAVPSHKQYGTGANPTIPDYITPFGFTGTVDESKYDINSNQITRANKVGTNWYKEITRNAPKQNHNIAVSAGSDKSSYYFSLGYLDNQGIARFQYQKRYSMRANTQFSISDRIRVGENAYLYYTRNPTFGNQGENSPFSMSFRESVLIPVYDIKGNFAGTKSQDLGNARNPYADIYRTKDNQGNGWNMNGNVYAEVDLLKHLTFRTNFGGTMSNGYGFAFNYVGYENAEGNTGANSFGESASYNTQWTYNNTLTYSNTLGDHTFKILGGTEAVRYYGRGVGATRSNYFSENPNFWTIGTGSPSGAANSGYAYQSSLWSQFARLEYSYAGKYLLNATVRRDGASVFVGEKRHAIFPGGSIAWRISQENFLKSVSWINDLKLRYSWAKLGSTGNVQNTNPYNLYRSSAGRSFYDIRGTSNSPNSGFYRSNIGNPETTFEGDIISNVGFDATLFKNKVDFTIDWYKKKVSGLLFDAQTIEFAREFVGDANLPKVNVGDMQNTGIDANLTYHGSLSKDLKFDVTGTFTSYNNKIIKIPGVSFFPSNGIRNLTVSRNEVGHSVGEFFGYKVLGIFQDASEVSKSPTQTDAAPGNFRYEDNNGTDAAGKLTGKADGKIDAADRTYIGNPNPKFTYGLNFAMSYKSFDFSTFFYGSQGNKIFDATRIYTDFPNFFKGAIRREVALNSWTPGNTSTTIPKLMTTGSFSRDLETNSYFVSDGSFLRNKQIQIGYTVPTKVLSRVGIERLRFYVQGTNLFTATKYKGLDPELQSSDIGNNTGFGIDQGNYPHTPGYLVGVNLNF
ncbi:TonB-dependent receptor [Segetibacter sp.]|uniref:SusC/RagA family TonB-linked outer membrane protein n=1 Tax=Segetibacter sp. TaxID=2231182 RepID=UPI00261CADA7|nr:TonB-dependent receptor [Segetibacter sp.]MCW3079122.1 TonB-dependent receptor [Segetibacter sp.]